MNKRTAGIVRGKWSFNERQYYLEGLNFYDEIIYIDPRHVSYHLDRETDLIIVDQHGYCLNHLSMLYTFGRADETLLLVKCLTMCGCPISDPYQAISRESLGKMTDSLGMFEAGAGTTAHILTSVEMAEGYLKGLAFEQFPLLNKPISGNKGKGIVPLHSVDEALEFCRRHFKRKDRFLYFEKLMNYVHEYRVYLIDGEIIEAYEKVSDGDGIALNLHQGARSQLIEEGHKKKIFTYVRDHLSGKYSVGVYGLDLAETDRGEFHVIEINRTPGFGGLRSLKLVNLPNKVHEKLALRSRPAPAFSLPKQTSTLTLLGDTNPGETYQLANAEKGQENILVERGYDQTFQTFYDFLMESDCTVANFEACLTNIRSSPLEGSKPYLDWTDVNKAPELLKKYRIRAVSLANNHTMDFGREGLAESIEVLKNTQITSFGAGLKEDQAQSAYHYDIKLDDQVRKIIVAAGFEYRKNHEDWHYYAKPDRAGVNSWARAKAKAQVMALRQANPEAFIIAFPHWGSNYLYVNERQQRLAREIIDAGADIIVGHGSHMMQEIELYRGRWIIYGIGNFVFNSPGRYGKFDVLPFGLIPRMTFSQQKDKFCVNVRLYPIHIDNRVTDYQTRFVNEGQFRKIVGFFMPHRKEQTGLEKRMRSGSDKHGYYFSFDLEPDAARLN